MRFAPCDFSLQLCVRKIIFTYNGLKPIEGNYFRGNPNPLVAMIVRWISDVPAPMVAETQSR